ncbi:hypothetical protein ABZX72_13640 [Streptomyces cyaneofuscatus]
MMPVQDFEALARVCPETVTLELINGKLEVKRVRDGITTEELKNYTG